MWRNGEYSSTIVSFSSVEFTDSYSASIWGGVGRY